MRLNLLVRLCGTIIETTQNYASVSSKATGIGYRRRETMIHFEEEAELRSRLHCRKMQRLRIALSLCTAQCNGGSLQFSRQKG
jgi:hypothetical protein